LTAPASGSTTPGNGVYATARGRFFRPTYQANNYWEDMLFNTSRPPASNCRAAGRWIGDRNVDDCAHRWNRMMLRKPSAVIITFGVAGALLAGCAGNQPTQPATSDARRTPRISNPDIGGAPQQSSRPAAALGEVPSHGTHPAVKMGRSPVTTAKVVKARQPPGPNDEESTTGAKPLNPCKLVTLAEAQAITREAIEKATQAPLGPTCIYSNNGHAAAITLAVETESFIQVTRHMSARKPVVILGRRSLCGRLGTQMLFVPLARYQLLNVTAPCGIARRFAALAVKALSA
jgi:hypothetical protein